MLILIFGPYTEIRHFLHKYSFIYFLSKFLTFVKITSSIEAQSMSCLFYLFRTTSTSFKNNNGITFQEIFLTTNVKILGNYFL